MEFLRLNARVIACCSHVTSIEIEPDKGLRVCVVGVVDLKVFLRDLVFWVEKFGSGSISFS